MTGRFSASKYILLITLSNAVHPKNLWVALTPYVQPKDLKLFACLRPLPNMHHLLHLLIHYPPN